MQLVKQTGKEEQLNTHRLFRNEDGAIDLASIMVGVIVIGLIGGVIAATVFGVIPWTQDKAAQQQLDTVVAAQSAYKGLASGVPPATPAGHAPNSYASSAQLEEAKLLKTGPKHCTVPTDEGKGYAAYSASDSGKIWVATDKKTAPEVFKGTLPTDCAFLGTTTDPNDLDGDGIPNAEDRDADGDGEQDNYVPGGPIGTLQGTPTPSTGTYNSVQLTTAASVFYSNVTVTSASVGKKISMHFIVSCVKKDGSFYERNYLSSWTPSSSATLDVTTTPCAVGERIDEYVVKPVTQEALNSGELSNRDTYGGYTFTFAAPAAGGYRWSEPDGYVKSGSFVSSYVSDGGSVVYATFKNASTASRKLASQYTMICERPDKSTYTLNRVLSFTSRAGYIEETTVMLNRCGTDRVTDYDIFPVTKLGLAENPENFDTYSMTGTKSWTEADGYQTSGNFVSSYVSDGGSAVYATFKNTTTASRKLASQYTMICERPDKSTYTLNRVLSFTSRAGYIEETTVLLNLCGTDRVTSYEIFPVTSLGEVENRENFGGYSMTGTKSWTEADGYQTSGNFVSSYVSDGGSTVYATFKNTTTASRKLASQYTMNCEKADKSVYSVNRILAYTTRAGVIEETTVSLTGCGADRITAYTIAPVTSLGEAANRENFGGYSMVGTKNWIEADGYQTSGNYVSSYIGDGGTTLYVTVKNSVTTSRTLAAHYTMTCERADKSTYSSNRVFNYVSRSGVIEESTLSLNRCGTDKIIAYSIAPVTKLGEVENRENFMGYTMTGSYNWKL